MPTEEKSDARTLEEKMLTSHLDTFAPELVSDDDSTAEIVSVGDLKLPKDLKKSLALLAENNDARYEADTTVSTGENALAQQRFERVRAQKGEIMREHVHQLSQGPKTPVITVEHHQSIAFASSAQAVNFKLAELARSHPEVKELLDERDDLLEKLSKIKK